MIRRGGILTSDRLVGDPGEKRRLRERYGASIVDMETAALAAIAHSRGITLACVRAVSDAAEDDLLAPFGKEIGESEVARTARVLMAGKWRDRYQGWKAGTAAARSSLRRFFQTYFEAMEE
jgi:nucleoside phosphorylase